MNETDIMVRNFGGFVISSVWEAPKMKTLSINVDQQLSCNLSL